MKTDDFDSGSELGELIFVSLVCAGLISVAVAFFLGVVK